MKIGKYDVPETCPEFCPGRNELPSQGGTCHRCPIFNCVPCKDENGVEFSLLRPDEYREDWAKTYLDMWERAAAPMTREE